MTLLFSLSDRTDYPYHTSNNQSFDDRLYTTGNIAAHKYIAKNHHKDMGEDQRLSTQTSAVSPAQTKHDGKNGQGFHAWDSEENQIYGFNLPSSGRLRTRDGTVSTAQIIPASLLGLV